MNAQSPGGGQRDLGAAQQRVRLRVAELIHNAVGRDGARDTVQKPHDGPAKLRAVLEVLLRKPLDIRLLDVGVLLAARREHLLRVVRLKADDDTLAAVAKSIGQVDVDEQDNEHADLETEAAFELMLIKGAKGIVWIRPALGFEMRVAAGLPNELIQAAVGVGRALEPFKSCIVGAADFVARREELDSIGRYGVVRHEDVDISLGKRGCQDDISEAWR